MNRHFYGYFTATLLVFLATANIAVSAESKAELDAADYFKPDSSTCGIQEAIDALPKDGGMVSIPPGVYCLRRAIVVRAHITLHGAGSTTILTRGKEVHAQLTASARKGQTRIEVESTTGFQVGDEVALCDDRMHGWYMAHGLVKNVEPGSITLAEPIESRNKEGVFAIERNAIVVNYFPFICANRMYDGDPVADVTIRDLTFDGNIDQNRGPWTDFTLAAIHFANVSDSRIRNCTILGSVGDGIGVQGGQDNRVESCLIENCRGHGLHPGTGLRGAVFDGNISRNNGGDGLYFCCLVVGIIVTNNLFHDNGGSGVGELGAGCDGSDSFNVVSNNVCRHNGRWGIQAVGGKNNLITGNVCLDNSQTNPGHYSGICIQDTNHTVVSGNRCGSDTDKPTQRFGIEESGDSDANVIADNVCAGNTQGGIAAIGPKTQVSANIGAVIRPEP